jgi:plasmid stabilization system protein ParE
VHPYSLHPRAAAEFDAVFAWYQRKDPEVAARFAEAVEEAILAFCERPLAYALWPKIDPALSVHRYVMLDFAYSIPFVLEAGSIYILAFAHQHRRPGYWVQRLRSKLRRRVSFRKKAE